jgi:hypothetical protein
MRHQCTERARLQAQTHAILAKLVDITTAQSAALKAGHDDDFIRLEKELVETVSAKEHVLQAMRQNNADHGCH